MEVIQKELRDEGLDVQFVSVNTVSAKVNQQALIDRCSFPLFQDTSKVNAWGQHGGAKDDIFVYDKQGILHSALFNGGDVNTNLQTSQGRENLKQAIRDAHGPK